MRNVFYSFHYQPDCQRAAQVRSMGALEGNAPVRDNDWETIVRGGDPAIERWIRAQFNGRSCTVVLVGNQTANRKWINYEISESWNAGMGVVAIRIHGLRNLDGQTSLPGTNPLDFVTFSNSGAPLSTVARCYDPVGSTSQERYAWIKGNLPQIVDEAIRIRNNN